MGDNKAAFKQQAIFQLKCHYILNQINSNFDITVFYREKTSCPQRHVFIIRACFDAASFDVIFVWRLASPSAK